MAQLAARVFVVLSGVCAAWWALLAVFGLLLYFGTICQELSLALNWRSLTDPPFFAAAVAGTYGLWWAIL